MDRDDLAYLPAVEQLRRFRAGELSPVEVLDAQIDRAATVEPVVNAFSEELFERAREQALEAERRYRDGRPRRLEGLTLGVKETMAVRGTVTTHGSLVHRDDAPAARSHPWVERLERAGAIVHARTTSPEFACAWVTTSRLNGVTRNPWDRELTAGASSGGSGATIAAGTSTLATGTDIGGSIRWPAAACGVVGYLPPHGRNPEVTPDNLDPYERVGPLARTVADCALVQNVGCGPHPEDSATLRGRPRLSLDPPGIEGWRIAWTDDLGNGVVSPAVAAGLRTALDQLEAAGATVERVDLGWGRESTEAGRAYLDHLFGRGFARVWERHPDLVCDYTAWYAQRSGTSDQERFLWSLEVAADMYRTLGPLLDRCHALVCPGFATQEIRADAMPWEAVEIAGRAFDCDYEPSLFHMFNMLGRVPVLQVPCGLGDDGLPMSVQVAVRTYDDARAFRIGAAMERQRPWLDVPGRRPRDDGARRGG